LGYATYDNAYSFSGVATVSVPLSVAYKIGRHEMGIGLDVGRNVFATMRRVQSMDGEVFHITQGITDVSLLNKYSLQPGLNYAYRMNEQVSVGLHMNCQMIRPLSSDRFEGIQNPNPWSFGITLKATLIQR
jgi:long-subunit fatty acid transport protein